MKAADYYIEHVACSFWALTGAKPAYPCDLEAALLWALPLLVRRVPGLTIADVNKEARKLRLPFAFDGANRRLCGCLLAYNDRGVIFLDGADTPDEGRFTLAHELAHFLLDYDAPRTCALNLLGETIRPVLDGLRPPTLQERMHAVLEDVSLGVMSHLMERPSGGIPSSSVLSVESRADRLALEILAPASLVLGKVPAYGGADYSERLAQLEQVLVWEHGLPRGLAQSYAGALLAADGGLGFLDWLAGI